MFSDLPAEFMNIGYVSVDRMRIYNRLFLSIFILFFHVFSYKIFKTASGGGLKYGVVIATRLCCCGIPMLRDAGLEAMNAQFVLLEDSQENTYKLLTTDLTLFRQPDCLIEPFGLVLRCIERFS